MNGHIDYTEVSNIIRSNGALILEALLDLREGELSRLAVAIEKDQKAVLEDIDRRFQELERKQSLLTEIRQQKEESK